MSKDDKLPQDKWKPCTERVYREGYWRSGLCKNSSKTVEQLEMGLCGLHLAAVRRREKKRLSDEVARSADAKRAQEAALSCDVLKRHGIEALPHWVRSQGAIALRHTGGVTLPPGAVDRLLVLLENA